MNKNNIFFFQYTVFYESFLPFVILYIRYPIIEEEQFWLGKIAHPFCCTQTYFHTIEMVYNTQMNIDSFITISLLFILTCFFIDIYFWKFCIMKSVL